MSKFDDTYNELMKEGVNDAWDVIDMIIAEYPIMKSKQAPTSNSMILTGPAKGHMDGAIVIQLVPKGNKLKMAIYKDPDEIGAMAVRNQYESEEIAIPSVKKGFSQALKIMRKWDKEYLGR